MSFKSLLKSFSRSAKEIPKNLYDDGSSLPDEKDMPSKLDALFRERRTAVPARIPPAPKKSIAICLIIVNELRHESIWREWVESCDHEHYEAHLFIHAKQSEQIRSPWVRSKLINKNFQPEWNSTEVIRAMLATLDSALSNSAADKFIFATESCIPIEDLATLADTLYRDDRSWLNARNEAESAWERGNCFESVNSKIIPRGAVWKALPGWIMLTRRHAMDIIGLIRHTGGYDLETRHNGITSIDLVRAFGPPGQWNEYSGGVFAPEEVFFATMLGLLGYLKPGYENSDEVKKLSISYATWARRGDANPQVIPALNERILEKIHSSGALMARKFDRNPQLFQQWKKLVLPRIPLNSVQPESPQETESSSLTGKRKRESDISVIDNDKNEEMDKKSKVDQLPCIDVKPVVIEEGDKTNN